MQHKWTVACIWQRNALHPVTICINTRFEQDYGKSRAQHKELQSHLQPSNILLLCGRQLLLCCFFQAAIFLMNCVTMFWCWLQTFVFQQYKRKICREKEHPMVPKRLITFARILFLSTSSMKKQPNMGFSMSCSVYFQY